MNVVCPLLGGDGHTIPSPAMASTSPWRMWNYVWLKASSGWVDKFMRRHSLSLRWVLLVQYHLVFTIIYNLCLLIFTGPKPVSSRSCLLNWKRSWRLLWGRSGSFEKHITSQMPWSSTWMRRHSTSICLGGHTVHKKKIYCTINLPKRNVALQPRPFNLCIPHRACACTCARYAAGQLHYRTQRQSGQLSVS